MITNTLANSTTPIDGAVYTVTKVATIDESTGQQTAVAGQTPIEVNAGQTVSLDQYAVYEVVQTTRAPGYYLNTEPFTIEFPLLSGGQIAADQTAEVHPKLIPVTGDASLLKTANDTATPVAGATFSLYRTADATAPSARPSWSATIWSQPPTARFRPPA